MDQELSRPRKRNHGNKDNIAQHTDVLNHMREINMAISVFVQLYKRCFLAGGKNWFAIEQK